MDFQLQSDQDLIHLYITGEEGGLVELIRRYQSKIYTSILNREASKHHVRILRPSIEAECVCLFQVKIITAELATLHLART